MTQLSAMLCSCWLYPWNDMLVVSTQAQHGAGHLLLLSLCPDEPWKGHEVLPRQSLWQLHRASQRDGDICSTDESSVQHVTGERTGAEWNLLEALEQLKLSPGLSIHVRCHSHVHAPEI